MSQYELSAAADISLSYMSDLERGKKFPSDKIWIKLATALEIQPYQLLYTGDKDKPINPEVFDNIRYDLENSLSVLIKEKFDEYNK